MKTFFLSLAVGLGVCTVIAVCSNRGCKHDGRLDHINYNQTLLVDISHWTREDESVVLGICSRCGQIVKAETTRPDSLSVSPVSNGAPTLQIGGMNKREWDLVDAATSNLIKRIESSTNAIVIRNCVFTNGAFCKIPFYDTNRFLMVQGCTIYGAMSVKAE